MVETNPSTSSSRKVTELAGRLTRDKGHQLYTMYDEKVVRLHSVLGRTCWLRLVVLLLHVYLGQFCYVDEYFDTTARKCCSQCQKGEGVKERCTNSTDTVCVECPEQTYSAKTEAGMICKACTSCSPARITTSLCTPTQDTACGSCAVGWFLFISSSGPNQCLKCSPCPPGQEAIHWEECAIVGLAEEYQCKPGELTVKLLVTYISIFMLTNKSQNNFNIKLLPHPI